MSIFALLALIAAFILAIVESRRAWWVPALIVLGVVLALWLTSGTQVSIH
jgi:hypothetical protein